MTDLETRFFPPVDELLSLDPSELAGHLLNYLMSNKNGYNLEPISLVGGLSNKFSTKHFLVRQALLEAFGWLEQHGLIGYDPSVSTTTTPWRAVTRAGRLVQQNQSLEIFKRRQLLQRNLMHPTIYDLVSNDFLKGDYDAAVHKAFVVIEHEVRDLTKFDASVVGTDLMRKAFDSTNGPLSNQNDPKPEREALAHLYAGAIGLGKNPHSHRRVGRGDALEAIQLIAFASFLLQLAEERVRITP